MYLLVYNLRDCTFKLTTNILGTQSYVEVAVSNLWELRTSVDLLIIGLILRF